MDNWYYYMYNQFILFKIIFAKYLTTYLSPHIIVNQNKVVYEPTGVNLLPPLGTKV